MGGVALIIALWGGGAMAQGMDYPALRDVTGVAAGDVLNIRAEPDAGAPILGSYAPDRRRIEVLRLSDDGRWAQVGLPEGNGWVALRYLAPLAKGPDLPLPVTCSGTEPFWSLDITDKGGVFRTPEGQSLLQLTDTGVARNGFDAALADDAGRPWQVIAQAMQCSDGMSDRQYGWRALLSGLGSAEAGGGAEIYAGCCSFDGG